MCFAAALPLALLLGGSALNMVGNNQAAHAQEDANNAERRRQQVLTNQQQSLFKDSLSKAGELNTPDAQNKAIADRTAALTAGMPSATAPGSYLPGSSSAPTVVAAAADKSGAATNAYTGNLAAAMARMGAPGDQLLTTNIGIGRNSGLIDQAATTKADSAAVLAAELRAAAHKGAFLRGIGSLASSIGGAMAGGGAGGGAIGGAGGSLTGMGGDGLLLSAARGAY